MNKRLFSLTLGFIAAAGLVLAAPPSHVAIRGARVFTVSGPVLEHGTVLMKDGLIEAVGEGIAIPADVTIIDGAGLNVYPGLIDALSTWGIPEAAGPATLAALATPAAPAAPVTPGQTPPPPQPRVRGPEDRPNAFTWVKAADLVKPSDKQIESARSAGFTTAVTFPKQGLLAGHGAVINLGGETSGDMVLDPSAGLYTSQAARGFASFPGSLMGVMAYMRQLWIDAAYYKLAKEAYAKDPVTNPRPAYDRALEGLLETHRLLLPATSRVQIERALRFGVEFKTPFVLYGGHAAYATADELKKAGVPVILNVKWPAKEKDSDPEEIPSMRTLQLRDKAPTTPAALAAAGVPFAISSEGLDAPKDVVKALKKSIDVGLKPADAIRALTLSAAEIYGMAGRLGSIEKGKIANLTVIKGDLFDDKAKVSMVFIDGKKYLPAPEAPTPPRPSSGAPATEVGQ
jgi:imidazolonepropionase-like amidohydrolase